MLPFNNRLTKRKDFERLYRAGRGFGWGSLYLKFAPNNLEESRIGVAVGLKFSKKAVVRNQIKRQISELLRMEIKRIKKGLDIVIMPCKDKNGKEKIEKDILKKDLLQILKETNIIN